MAKKKNSNYDPMFGSSDDYALTKASAERIANEFAKRVKAGEYRAPKGKDFDRKLTTLGGTPRDEVVTDMGTFLDEYGPLSNLMRLLGVKDESPHALNVDRMKKSLSPEVNPIVRRVRDNIDRIGREGIKIPLGPSKIIKKRKGGKIYANKPRKPKLR